MGYIPSKAALAASKLEPFPIFKPTISLEEQPMTKRSPRSSFAAASSSSMACAACFVTS